MTDETIRTRVLQTARLNWKAVLASACSLVVGIVGTSIGFGKYIEHDSAKDQQLERIESKVDKLSSLAQKFDDLSGRVERIENNWDDAGTEAGKGYQPRKRR